MSEFLSKAGKIPVCVHVRYEFGQKQLSTTGAMPFNLKLLCIHSFIFFSFTLFIIVIVIELLFSSWLQMLSVKIHSAIVQAVPFHRVHVNLFVIFCSCSLAVCVHSLVVLRILLRYESIATFL